MRKVKEIGQLREKEHKLKKINLYQRENLKRKASKLMLPLAGILAFLSIAVTSSIFFKKRALQP